MRALGMGRTAVDAWREALIAGKAMTPPEHVFKAYTATEMRADQATRQIKFRITTGSPDRMQDIVDPNGWQLDAYRKNPVVLWAHQYGSGGLLGTGGVGLPIARALDIRADSAGLVSVAQFATKEQYAFADTVYQLLVGGFLNATSVGFRPLKHAFNEARQGIDFLEHELLEYSVVPIPANPEALIDAAAKGIDTAPMREWAEALLDSLQPEPGMWLPRRQVELVLANLPRRQTAVRPKEHSGCPAEGCEDTTCPKRRPTRTNHPVPGGYVELEDFLDATTPITAAEAAGLTEVVVDADLAPPVEKPYPSEHACRVADPGGFTKFRRGTREHDGKSYGVIYAKPKGEGGWQEQAYRYSKDTWSASEARSHCSGHKGRFEAASGEKQRLDPAMHAEVVRLLEAGQSREALDLLKGLEVVEPDGVPSTTTRLALEIAEEMTLEILEEQSEETVVSAEMLERLFSAHLAQTREALKTIAIETVMATINKLRGRAD